MKRKLYEAFIERMDAAYEAGYYFEACWYASALLEDRFVSMLQNTGGMLKNGKAIRMLGPKIAELEERAKDDKVLKEAFDFGTIKNWIKQRNKLMHEMAEGTMPLEDVQSGAEALAKAGVHAVRDAASAALRLKKNLRRQRKKIESIVSD